MLFDDMKKKRIEKERDEASAEAISVLQDLQLYLRRNFTEPEPVPVSKPAPVSTPTLPVRPRPAAITVQREETETSAPSEQEQNEEPETVDYSLPTEQPQPMFSSLADEYESTFIPFWWDAEKKDGSSDDKVNRLFGLEDFPAFAKSYATDDSMPGMDMPFSAKLRDLMTSRCMSSPELYHRAQIDKATFSRIVNSEYSSPSKDTVISLALGLRLSIDEAKDLLERAGFTLSHSVKRDVVIEYCFIKAVYNVVTVNCLLDETGCRPLGRIIY